MVSSDEIEKILTNNILDIVSKERFILLVGKAGSLKSTIATMISLTYIKRKFNGKGKVMYIFSKNPPEYLLKKRFENIALFNLRDFTEQYFLINSLPRFLISNNVKIRCIVIDDILSLYFSSPLGAHRVTSLALLSEQISLLKELSLRRELLVLVISYLSRSDKPILWKIFSNYFNCIIKLDVKNDTLMIEVLNKEFSKVLEESVSIGELIGVILEDP